MNRHDFIHDYREYHLQRELDYRSDPEHKHHNHGNFEYFEKRLDIHLEDIQLQLDEIENNFETIYQEIDNSQLDSKELLDLYDNFDYYKLLHLTFAYYDFHQSYFFVSLKYILLFTYCEYISAPTLSKAEQQDFQYYLDHRDTCNSDKLHSQEDRFITLARAEHVHRFIGHTHTQKAVCQARQRMNTTIHEGNFLKFLRKAERTDFLKMAFAEFQKDPNTMLNEDL